MNTRIQKALANLGDALDRLEEAGTVGRDDAAYNLVIDGTIKRFEFTFELFWKTLKHIEQHFGTQVDFPRQVLEAAYSGKLIDNENAWLQMLRDRNQAVHIYNQAMAEEIYLRVLQKHIPILRATYQRLAAQYGR